MHLLQNSFAFAAANGLLRKVVPAINKYDAVILDVTEVRLSPSATGIQHQTYMQQLINRLRKRPAEYAI